MPAGAGEVWGDRDGLLVKDEAGFRLRQGALERALELPREVRVEGVFPVRQQVFVSGTFPVSDADAIGDELYLALASREGLRALGAPGARPAGSSRENAVPLRSPSGELSGLAWLEGESRRQNAVMTSTWNGNAWSAPAAVTGPGPGSQTALAAATLDDGSSLLVWARFDGKDDEIVASRRVHGDWSTPVPIADDNAVPDIVPAIVAVEGGALAAWARYDGHDYRVVLSRFSGGRWSDPVEMDDRASVFPTLERTERGARLLHLRAGLAAWTIVDLDAAGRELRRATVEASDRERPVAQADRLVWADRELAIPWQSPRSGE